MSIEITSFTVSTAAANFSEVAEYLKKNAAEYFSEISVENGIVNCKVGDTACMVLNPTTSSSKVILGNGVEGKLINSSTSIGIFSYAYKTKKGIMLYHNNAFGVGRIPDVFITKSSKGNTSLVWMIYDGSSTSMFCADLLESKTIAEKKGITTSDVTLASLTTLTPVVLGDSVSYADGLFLTVFTQYINSGAAILEVDGKKYAYTGYLALEE